MAIGRSSVSPLPTAPGRVEGIQSVLIVNIPPQYKLSAVVSEPLAVADGSSAVATSPKSRLSPFALLFRPSVVAVPRIRSHASGKVLVT